MANEEVYTEIEDAPVDKSIPPDEGDDLSKKMTEELDK